MNQIHDISFKLKLKIIKFDRHNEYTVTSFSFSDHVVIHLNLQLKCPVIS